MKMKHTCLRPMVAAMRCLLALLLVSAAGYAADDTVDNTPVAMADRYDLGIDESFKVPAEAGLLSNDTTGDTSYAVLLDTPSNGELEFRADGSFTYRPHLGFIGTDSFTYRLRDGLSTSSATTVTLNVGPLPTGYLTLHYYDGIKGTDISSFTGDSRYPDQSTWSTYYDALEAHVPDRAFPSGARTGGFDFQGYIHPPATGKYTFYAKGLAMYEFRLSTDDDPANTAVLISGGGSSAANSSPVTLKAGQRYYFQALNKRNDKTDTYFQVDWSGPGLPRQIISSNHLSHVPLVPTANPDSFQVYEGEAFEYLGEAREIGPGTREGILDNDTLPIWYYDEILFREGRIWQLPPSCAHLIDGTRNGTLSFNENGTFSYTPNSGFTGKDSFTYSVVSVGDFLEDLGGGLTYTSAPATVTLNVAPRPPSDPLLEDLYAYWPMDGNARDLSGNGHDGKASGVTYSSGVVGKMAEFDNNDFIDLAGTEIKAPWSISMWVRKTAASETSVLLDGPQSAIFMEAQLWDKKHRNVKDSGLGLMKKGEKAPSLFSGLDLPQGEWVHFFATSEYKGVPTSSCYLYLDGVYRGESAALGGRLPVAALGDLNAVQSAAMDVDEVIVWNRVLNEDDIRTLIGRGLDGTGFSDSGTVGNHRVPESRPDEYVVEQNAALKASSVLANDTDPEGAVMTAVLHGSGPSHASNFRLNSDGTFTYLPVKGYTGRDSFTYRANDGDAGGYPTKVNITVLDPTAPPYGLTHEVYRLEQSEKNLLDDPDFPDNPDTILYQTGGFGIPDRKAYSYKRGHRLSGFLVPPVDTYYGFSMDAGSMAEFWFSETDDPADMERILTSADERSKTFRLKAGRRYYCEFRLLRLESDERQSGRVNWLMYGLGPISNETVIADQYLIPVNGNRPPDLKPGQHYTLFADETFSLPAPGVLGGSEDVEGDRYAASVVQGASSGSLTLSDDGSFSYTPNSGFRGTDRFTFKVNDGFSDVATATVTLDVVDGVNPNAVFSDWLYGGSPHVDLVEAAQYTGWYACASRTDGQVEVRDYRQDLLYTVDRKQIEQLVGVGSGYEIASVAFSCSGRLLFIGLVGPGKDPILRLNVNTKKMNVFTWLDMADNLNGGNLGLLHYDGELYVGTDSGVKVYDAPLDLTIGIGGKHSYSIPSGSTWVNDIALDMYNEQLYLTTPDALYRMDVYREPYVTIGNSGSQGSIAYRPLSPKPLTQLATPGPGNTFGGVAVVRAFGDGTEPVLFVHERTDDTTSRLLFADAEQVKAKGPLLALGGYTEVSGDLKGISATPCSRLMLCRPALPQLMADGRDSRYDVLGWAKFHTKQQVRGLKSDCMANQPGLYTLGKRRPPFSTHNDGFNVYGPATAQRMIVADYLFNDPDALDMAEEALAVLAGTYSEWVQDKTGRKVPNWMVEATPDGVQSELPDLTDGSQGKSFSLNTHWRMYGSILAIYQAYKDRSERIRKDGEFLLDRAYRFADYWCAPQGGAKQTFYHGPNYQHFFQYQGENPAHFTLSSALDPLGRKNFYEYFDKPSHMRRHSYLSDLDMHASFDVPGHVLAGDERVMFLLKGSHMNNMARFGDMIFKDPEWRKEWYNLVFGHAAVGDDSRSPYLFYWYKCTTDGNALGSTPYLAGPHDELDVGKSKPSFESGGSRTAFEVTDLHQVTGMCAAGDTWPALTQYLAYREGRYQRGRIRTGWKGREWPFLTFGSYNRFSEDFQQIEWTDRRDWFALADVIQKGAIRESRSIPDFIYREPVAETNAAGNTVLKFWQPMKHRVLGSSDGTNWVSYGFQRAPFELEDGRSYTHYRAEVPEGMSLATVMSGNIDFEAGNLSTWIKSGKGYSFSVGTAGTTGLAGTWAQVSSGSSSTSKAGLCQTVMLADDLDGSAYIARGNGFLSAGATGQGYLRIAWDNDANPRNGTRTPVDSNVMGSGTPVAEFRVDTVKPAGCDYLHLYFVVDGNSEAADYRFDNLSLVRGNGPLVRAFFEAENLNRKWDSLTDPDGLVSVTTDPAEVLDGKYALKIETTPDQIGSTAQLEWAMDVTGDAIGTRYVGRLRADAMALEATEIDLTCIYVMADGSEVPFAASNDGDNVLMRIEPHYDRDYGELLFTIRKCSAGWDNAQPNLPVEIRFILEVTRLDKPSSNIDAVILDDFRLYKEAEFPIHPMVRSR